MYTCYVAHLQKAALEDEERWKIKEKSGQSQSHVACRCLAFHVRQKEMKNFCENEKLSALVVVDDEERRKQQQEQ